MADDQNTGSDEGIDLDTELEFEDGTTATLGEILQAQQQAREEVEQARQQISSLENFRSNATKLMRGESPDVQAAYEVLRGAGFSDDEARQYAQEYVNGEDDVDQEADVSEEAQIEQMLKRTTRAAEERAEAALRQTNELRLRLLKEQMDKNVVSAID